VAVASAGRHPPVYDRYSAVWAPKRGTFRDDPDDGGRAPRTDRNRNRQREERTPAMDAWGSERAGLQARTVGRVCPRFYEWQAVENVAVCARGRRPVAEQVRLYPVGLIMMRDAKLTYEELRITLRELFPLADMTDEQLEYLILTVWAKTTTRRLGIVF
jgi:hypothetical protein